VCCKIVKGFSFVKRVKEHRDRGSVRVLIAFVKVILQKVKENLKQGLLGDWSRSG
jgi:hypothetical protein